MMVTNYILAMSETINLCYGIYTIIIAFNAVPGMGVVIDCYKRTVDMYDGHQQTTANGTPCIRWESVDEEYTKSERNFPDNKLSDAANFCRAMNYNFLWCWTGSDSSFNYWGKCGIKKCDSNNSVTKCGTLRIEQPALLGRNVTFSFTPDSHDTNAILEWQRRDNRNPWYTRPLTYKFTQFYEDGTYYMILTDSVAGKDEVFYRIHYYNESTQCFMETETKLTLEDNPRNPCGFVYLRYERVVEYEDIKLEYYPSETSYKNQHKWFRYRNEQYYVLTIGVGNYKEAEIKNGMFELTISTIKQSMNGRYGVNCGTRFGLTNLITVIVLVPPGAPAFTGLQDIEGCNNCIIRYYMENTDVHCKTSGGTKPIETAVTIGDEPFHAGKNDNESSVYIAFFTATNRRHNATITCSVMNEALSSPLTTRTRLYVIKSPNIALSVPDKIEEGSSDIITCMVPSSRPAPTVYFQISGTEVTSAYGNSTFNSVTFVYTSSVTLRTFMREWNGKNISCCRYNRWFKPPRFCSEPKMINLLYRSQIEFNTSGSTLNIYKGEETYVNCLSDSSPVSNITWIEESDNGNKIKRRCEFKAECVLDINADTISKRRFVCAINYLQILDNKTLNVNINIQRKQEQLSDNENSSDSTNGTLIGIVTGTCVALVLIAVILAIFIKKKQSKVKAKHETDQTRHRNENRPARGNEENEFQNENAYIADPTDVTYSQPIKNKNEYVENEATYSVVNKTGKPINQALQYTADGQCTEDGQLTYVELDFDPNEGAPKGAITNRRNSPTEYVAIDFVKTAANSANEDDTPKTEDIYVNQ